VQQEQQVSVLAVGYFTALPLMSSL